jgi:hypothetical protein
MSEQMRRILESKARMRKQLAALPFAEKLKLLEQLRDRALAIATSPLKQKMSRRGTASSRRSTLEPGGERDRVGPAD